MRHDDLCPGEEVTLRRTHDGTTLQGRFLFRDTVRACFEIDTPPEQAPHRMIRPPASQLLTFQLRDDGTLERVEDSSTWPRGYEILGERGDTRKAQRRL